MKAFLYQYNFQKCMGRKRLSELIIKIWIKFEICGIAKCLQEIWIYFSNKYV